MVITNRKTNCFGKLCLKQEQGTITIDRLSSFVFRLCFCTTTIAAESSVANPIRTSVKICCDKA